MNHGTLTHGEVANPEVSCLLPNTLAANKYGATAAAVPLRWTRPPRMTVCRCSEDSLQVYEPLEEDEYNE